MSTVHRVCLMWWEARGAGVAEADGVSVKLHKRPPVLRAIRHLSELCFVAGEGCAYVQDATQARRDLLEGEMREIHHYLAHMALSARHGADRAVL